MRHIQSIHDLLQPITEGFQEGPFYTRPQWYACYEDVLGAQTDHLILDHEAGQPVTLVPFFLFEKPAAQYSHNIFFLLSGGLLGKQNFDQKLWERFYPYAASLVPNAYDYSLTSVAGQQLTADYVRYLEERAWDKGARVMAYYFLDQRQEDLRGILVTQGYQHVPVLLKWCLDTTQYDSYDQWLKSLPARRRRNLTVEWHKIEASGLKAELWDVVKLREHLSFFESLICEHQTKYRHDGERLCTIFRNYLHYLPDHMIGYIVKQADQIMGFSLGIRCGDEEHLKQAAYRKDFSFGYFYGTYYIPLREGFQRRLKLDFGPSTDQVKKNRGFVPVVKNLYFKFRNEDADVIKFIQQRREQSELFLRKMMLASSND